QALGPDQDDAAQHEVHAEGGDERGEVRVDHEPPDAGTEDEPGGGGGEDAEEGIVAGLHDEGKDPAGHAHGGRKAEVDLTHRDDEDQRHHHEQHHRQALQHGAVDAPLREHARVADEEDQQHHHEDKERAERGPVVAQVAAKGGIVGVPAVRDAAGGGGIQRLG